jgi:hypothetical protein
MLSRAGNAGAVTETGEPVHSSRSAVDLLTPTTYIECPTHRAASLFVFMAIFRNTFIIKILRLLYPSFNLT